MNPYYVPSLQHLALAEIAVVLSNNHGVKAIIERNRFYNFSGMERVTPPIRHSNFWSRLTRSRYPKYTLETPLPWHIINEDLMIPIRIKVQSMIPSLNLAPSLGQKVLNFIPCIIEEIEKWEEDHCEILPKNFDAQVYFCWKSVGTIDRESTVENLFIHGNLSVINRFYLACWYCMESRLPSLWDNIHDPFKAQLISELFNPSPLSYWTTRLDNLHSQNPAFPEPSYITNSSALHYFYNKCANEDRKKAFLDNVLSKQGKNIDLVQFCVKELCQHGREQLSSVQCCNILRGFLNWSLQSLFLGMSEYLLMNLDQDGISDLLNDIERFILDHTFVDTDYLNLLKEFWKQIPSDHKNSIINSPQFQYIQKTLQATDIH